MTAEEAKKTIDLALDAAIDVLLDAKKNMDTPNLMFNILNHPESDLNRPFVTVSIQRRIQ